MGSITCIEGTSVFLHKPFDTFHILKRHEWLEYVRLGWIMSSGLQMFGFISAIKVNSSDYAGIVWHCCRTSNVGKRNCEMQFFNFLTGGGSRQTGKWIVLSNSKTGRICFCSLKEMAHELEPCKKKKKWKCVLCISFFLLIWSLNKIRFNCIAAVKYRTNESAVT